MIHSRTLIAATVVLTGLATATVLMSTRISEQASVFLPAQTFSQPIRSATSTQSHLLQFNREMSMIQVLADEAGNIFQEVQDSHCDPAALESATAKLNVLANQYQISFARYANVTAPALTNSLSSQVRSLLQQQRSGMRGTLIGGGTSAAVTDRQLTTLVGFLAQVDKLGSLYTALGVSINNVEGAIYDGTCANPGAPVSSYPSIPDDEIALNLELPPYPPQPPFGGSGGSVNISTDGSASECPEVDDVVTGGSVSGGSDGGTEPEPETEDPGMAEPEPEHPSAEEPEGEDTFTPRSF